jgi:uncharacterized Fe-S cluster-containing radical SAM superfamily protein
VEMENGEMEPFDPFERASEIEKIVMDGTRRKYYRFRYSRHYGGIVTADAVGCNILCAYCWNHSRNQNPEKVGTYRSPEEVADKLLKIARKKGADLFRVSGAEPILGRRSMEHLVEVVKGVNSPFVLETNGLLLGRMPELVDLLKGLPITVRVAVKGWDENSFERITGATGSAFSYQLAALEKLSERGIPVWPAIMVDVFGEEGERRIRDILAEIGLEIEEEELNRYPFVMENLKKRGVEVRIS